MPSGYGVSEQQGGKMEGYDVVSSDDKKVGRVVGKIGDNLIVEHGTLRKSRTALPKVFTEVHDSDNQVRATVSKAIFDDAPCVDSAGELDDQAVAEHYGLAESFADPESEGYGDTLADDPGISAEVQANRVGADNATQQRAALRDSLVGGGDVSNNPGRPIIPPPEAERSERSER